VAVTDEVCDSEIFDGQPAVGLGELGGDLVKEASSHVGDTGMLAGEPPGGLGPVARASLCARQGTGTAPQPLQAADQRLGSMEAADLGSVRGRHHSEGGKTTIHANEPATVHVRARLMAAPWMEVRGLHVQADVPAAAVAADRGEQDPGAWRYDRLAGHWVELLDRPK